VPGAEGVLPVEAVRAHFPALERRVAGRSVAYFDGPAGTQVPRAVAQAVADHLLHHNGNRRFAFPTSTETDALVQRGRQAAADFLGASPDEVVFGANMTTLTFHLARALGRQLHPGDEIVVTELDHHANIDPWADLARERGLRLRVVPLRAGHVELHPDDLRQALGARTRLLAIGAASNAVGTLNDLAPWLAQARALGATTFVDAVHSAAHVLPDVRALGCDFLACSAYKFYGPHVGLLYGRAECLAALELPRVAPAPATPPDSLETGTANFEGLAGVTAALDFLAALAPAELPTRRARLAATFAALHARGQALFARLYEGLAELPGVRLYGPAPGRPRTPTLAFTLAGYAPGELAQHLAEAGLFLSHGHFYAATAVARLGCPAGVLRAGCAAYTNAEEVERLVAAVAACPPRL
jgi:cysteine desulfurase family protein (TIGR01976 family)